MLACHATACQPQADPCNSDQTRRPLPPALPADTAHRVGQWRVSPPLPCLGCCRRLRPGGQGSAWFDRNYMGRPAVGRRWHDAAATGNLARCFLVGPFRGERGASLSTHALHYSRRRRQLSRCDSHVRCSALRHAGLPHVWLHSTPGRGGPCRPTSTSRCPYSNTGVPSLRVPSLTHKYPSGACTCAHGHFEQHSSVP